MSHLDQSFASFDDFLEDADGIFGARLTALNSSGVSGNIVVGVIEEDDGTGYINIAVTAAGLAPDVGHAQHIHGRFDEDGNPIDSVNPTIADDADRDGMVEVLEGLSRYGDILLPIETDANLAPMADDEGNLSFIQSFAIEDMSNFVSPVTGEQYSYQDIAQLALREYVIHGVVVPDGIGEGTEGEVDGGENGFIGILPAASAELEEIDRDAAERLLDDQRVVADATVLLDGGDNVFAAGAGNDFVRGGRGNDVIAGEGDDDVLFGDNGNDQLDGGLGDDLLLGGNDDDTLLGGEGDDTIVGGRGNDTIDGGNGADLLRGDAGDDTVDGSAGDDIVLGGGGDDQLEGRGGDDILGGAGGSDTLNGGAGADLLIGGSEDDALNGGAGDDRLGGGGGNDTLNGGAGIDDLRGGAGDDLLLGGLGDDLLLGQEGLDILGGGNGNDTLKGGTGADEFHFDAGLGADFVTDFTQGEDVISFKDGGAIEFANSTETQGRGDSDLAAEDFDTITSYDDLDAANDQQIVFSTGGTADLEAAEGGAEIEAFIAANDGDSTFIYHDDNWSDLDGREVVAVLDDFTGNMTAADFDVY